MFTSDNLPRYYDRYIFNYKDTTIAIVDKDLVKKCVVDSTDLPNEFTAVDALSNWIKLIKENKARPLAVGVYTVKDDTGVAVTKYDFGMWNCGNSLVTKEQAIACLKYHATNEVYCLAKSTVGLIEKVINEPINSTTNVKELKTINNSPYFFDIVHAPDNVDDVSAINIPDEIKSTGHLLEWNKYVVSSVPGRKPNKDLLDKINVRLVLEPILIRFMELVKETYPCVEIKAGFNNNMSTIKFTLEQGQEFTVEMRNMLSVISSILSVFKGTVAGTTALSMNTNPNKTTCVVEVIYINVANE